MRVADRSNLMTAVLLSVAIHAALILAVPGYRPADRVAPAEEVVEISTRAIEPAPPPVVPEEIATPPRDLPEPRDEEPPAEVPDLAEIKAAQAPAEQPAAEPTPGPEGDAPEAAATPAVPAPQELAARAQLAEEASRVVSSALALKRPEPGVSAPSVLLPARRSLTIDAPGEITFEPPRPASVTVAAPAEGRRATRSPAPRAADLAAARDVAARLMGTLGGAAPASAPVPNPQPLGAPEIGGEVGSQRTVARTPAPPTARIDHPVTVEMEFWVAPGGEVVRAQPIRTGDARLDTVAAEYVKQFRFNALEPGRTEEQRGTILVRFSLR